MNIDATAPRGDGLPERLVTDVALWADLHTPDGHTDASAIVDRSSVGTDGAFEQGPDISPDLGVEAGCGLWGATCVGQEACYPFPFEGAATGESRCAFQGVGGPSVPCQSQLECDGTTLCSAPGQPDSVCRQRCQLADARCPTGMRCVPFLSYAGVGACQ